MSGKPKATTVEWSDDSCHLSKKQMKEMGFKSTWEMMEYYYDCKPGETKHEILHKSVRAMICVLGRIDRMLRTPVTPNDANSGLFDRERDSHLYQIVLVFLYGKKCLKNALNNLDDTQLDKIVSIYTSLVNEAFNEAPLNPRIRNFKPVEEEGPEGVYHQLYEGMFSIDHLIEYLKKQKFPDAVNPRKLVGDPVINGILNSMDKLVSNPENTVADPRIYGGLLHDSFTDVARNKFKDFRPGESGEVLRYKDEDWAENEELAFDLRAIVAAEAGAGAVKTAAAAVPHAEGGAGSGGLPKTAAREEGAGRRGPPKASALLEHTDNINNVLSSFAKLPNHRVVTPPPTSEQLYLTMLAERMTKEIKKDPGLAIHIDDTVNNIILRNFSYIGLKNVDELTLPKGKAGRVAVHYEFKIISVTGHPLCNISQKSIPKPSQRIYIAMLNGITKHFYYEFNAMKLKSGNYVLTTNDIEYGALAMIIHKDTLRSDRLTKKSSRQSSKSRHYMTTRKNRKN